MVIRERIEQIMKNLPKIAVGATEVNLKADEIELIERTADGLGLSTIRYWEKKME